MLSGATAPTDIWILDLAAGDLRQLTHSPHAGVDLEGMVRPELVRYAARDGLELSGWLYRPVGVERAAPFVISFHGGPEGQARPSFNRVRFPQNEEPSSDGGRDCPLVRDLFVGVVSLD